MRKVIVVLLLLNVCFLCYHGWNLLMSKHPVMAPLSENEVAKIAKQDQARGMMSVAESERITPLYQSVYNTGTLSADDFAFTCDVMDKSMNRPGLVQIMARAKIFDIWLKMKSPTYDQQKRITDLAAAILNRKNSMPQGNMLGGIHIPESIVQKGIASERVELAIVLGNMTATKPVALLLPLLDDKDAKVQKRAREALAKLGYKG